MWYAVQLRKAEEAIGSTQTGVSYRQIFRSQCALHSKIQEEREDPRLMKVMMLFSQAW